jgi:hypothetical protein
MASDVSVKLLAFIQLCPVLTPVAHGMEYCVGLNKAINHWTNLAWPRFEPRSPKWHTGALSTTPRARAPRYFLQGAITIFFFLKSRTKIVLCTFVWHPFKLLHTYVHTHMYVQTPWLVKSQLSKYVFVASEPEMISLFTSRSTTWEIWLNQWISIGLTETKQLMFVLN